MKRKGSVLVTIGIIITTAVVGTLGYFFYQNQQQTIKQQTNKSIPSKPLTIFITSFEECTSPENYPDPIENSNNYNLKNKYKCQVTYDSLIEPQLFNKCIEIGGTPRCHPNPPIWEDCSIPGKLCTVNHYNPEVTLPVDYSGCKVLSDMRGSFLSIQLCELNFPKETDSFYDKGLAQKLYNQCLQNGGEIINAESGTCVYSVFQPNPNRKSYVAEECKNFNQLTGVDKKICNWANN